MASENEITVEFGFGDVKLEPSANGMLTVTLMGISTFVDPILFNRAIADGIFNNSHPAIAAQQDGVLDLGEAQDVFQLGEPKQAVSLGRFEITRYANGLFIETAPDHPVESTFDLYVDGYTLRSTETVGEMSVTSPEGDQTIIQTKQLTAFLDRRMSPGESDNLG